MFPEEVFDFLNAAGAETLTGHGRAVEHEHGAGGQTGGASLDVEILGVNAIGDFEGPFADGAEPLKPGLRRADAIGDHLIDMNDGVVEDEGGDFGIVFRGQKSGVGAGAQAEDCDAIGIDARTPAKDVDRALDIGALAEAECGTGGGHSAAATQADDENDVTCLVKRLDEGEHLRAVGAVIVDEDDGGAFDSERLLPFLEDDLGVQEWDEPTLQRYAVFADEADGIVVGALRERVEHGCNTRRMGSEVDQCDDDAGEDNRDEKEPVEEAAKDTGERGSIFDLELTRGSPEADVGEHDSANQTDG